MRIALLALALTVSSVGATLSLWSRVPDTHEALSPDPQMMWIEVSVEERSVSEPVILTPEVTSGATLHASGVDLVGTVTSLPVSTTGTVSHGETVAHVDGVPIIALTTDEPFHRDLASGDRGEDVRTLLELLGTMGLIDAHEIDDRFGPAAAAAVQDYNEEHFGAERDRTWHADRVLWLPRADAGVSAIHTAVGAAWPGSGGDVVTLADTIPGATLIAPHSVVDDAPETFVIVFEGETYPVAGGSGSTWRVDEPIAGLLPPGEDTREDGQETNASLRPASGEQVVPVPVGAVVLVGGRSCLHVRDGQGAHWTTVHVHAERTGEFWLDPETLVGVREVVANATSLRSPRTCA